MMVMNHRMAVQTLRAMTHMMEKGTKGTLPVITFHGLDEAQKKNLTAALVALRIVDAYAVPAQFERWSTTKQTTVFRLSGEDRIRLNNYLGAEEARLDERAFVPTPVAAAKGHDIPVPAAAMRASNNLVKVEGPRPAGPFARIARALGDLLGTKAALAREADRIERDGNPGGAHAFRKSKGLIS